MQLEFELGTATSSNNQLLRMHWSRYRKQKVALAWTVKALTAGRAWPSPPPAFVQVEILRVGAQLLDPDNLVGGAKMLIDCLVDCGLIVDDSEQHIGLRVRGEIGAPPRTQVLLESWEA